MPNNSAWILLALGIAWSLQYLLSFWQMRRYYGRLRELRRRGQVWVGMEGSAWRGRQYAVLVLDRKDNIVRVEQLSGWTVMATLRPVDGLEGRPVSDLLDDTIQLPVSKKLLLALRNAVKHMQEYKAKMAAKAQAADEAAKHGAPDQEGGTD